MNDDSDSGMNSYQSYLHQLSREAELLEAHAAEVRELQQKIERMKRTRKEEEKEQRLITGVRRKLTPLSERLERLLSEIPEAVQREGLRLPDLQARLHGLHSPRCHPGALAKELRSTLGWTRKRDWSGNSCNGTGALWYPPKADRKQL